MNTGAGLSERLSISFEEPSLHLYHPVEIQIEISVILVLYYSICSTGNIWFDSLETLKYWQNVNSEVALDKSVCHKC